MNHNVIVVVIDALRRDSVGIYGSKRGLTPNIDALGQNGTTFENAFACTNTTDPSVTSMHTGRDPETVVKHHGPFVTGEEKRRAESVPILPEQLQVNGYHTAVTGRTLGRWHQRGFDYYPEESLDRYQRRALGEYLERISPKIREFAGSLYDRYASATRSSSDAVDDFLEVTSDGPFYGFIHLMDTHVPYTHEAELVSKYLDRFDYPNADLAEFFRAHEDNGYVSETMREYSDEQDYEAGLARWFAKYDAAVRIADRKVGKLIQGLEDRGVLDETTVIITSDHGESLDEHGIYFDHHGLYEPEIRVPLVFRGPSIPDANRTEFVQLYDLAPTILSLTGTEATIDADGRSLVPLLGGEGDWEDREYIIAHESHAQSRRAIRTREYKFVEHVPEPVLERERGDSFECGYCNTTHGDKRELFDLRADPAETENIIADNRDIAAELEEALNDYFDGLETLSTDDSTVEYENEEELMDRLKDLGYR
ncbi:sulfatase [Halapricum desulfuricans]|uniref:Arylsulfatase A or related enzyme n=1 Tax=Halapricum desulfuricans TaxID=2841257 RepID=A0A897N766_9EURY|nr:sulfatase [Halapricum desulfuricans]QSG06955.1 Arylsulfatase A or related enzyme [Halapricum desulfuricans]